MNKKPTKPKKARKGSPKAIPHILGLEGWYVTGTTQLDGYRRLDIEMEKPQLLHVCLSGKEQMVADNPIKYGSKTTEIRDLPLNGERIDLRARRPRLKCRQCPYVGAAHAGEGLGKDIHPRHRMTMRLVNYIRDRAASRTVSAIGKELGIAEPTVRKVFKDFLPPKHFDMKIKAPRVLGIDDKHIGKKRLATTFVDLENRVLLEIYNENKADALKPFVDCLDDLRRIEVVCIDMSGTYLSFCKKYLPQANVVIDKFHVIQKANSAVDKARIKVRESLSTNIEKQSLSSAKPSFLRRKPLNEGTKGIRDTWLKNSPQLAAAWDAKEAFYGFYAKKSAEEAEEYYDNWLESLDEETKKQFKDLTRCMDNHRTEILNYFRVTNLEEGRKVTNGYLEGLNLQIERILHDAPRYNFETLRQKLLQTYGTGRKKEIKFRRTGLKGGGPRERLKPEANEPKMDLKDIPKVIKRRTATISKSGAIQMQMFFLEQDMPLLNTNKTKKRVKKSDS